VKVLRADIVGVCYGVRRALEVVERQLASPGPALVTIGPLIHNPQEVERLRQAGVEVAEDIAACVGRRAVVRTHGITAGQTQLAALREVELIDATCPHVKTPRRKILEFGRQGRTVLLAGDRKHPEVVAQVSYAAGPLWVVQDASELPDLPRQTPIGLVAQTTLSEQGFEELAAAVQARFDDVVVGNTICQDTRRRQQAALELAGRVDLVLVVGGRNSSNTNRLAEICRRVQPRTVLIESPDDLAGLDWTGVQRLGLTSGASTPDWLIRQVEQALASQVPAGAGS
jgi:4-hydroxy-3-methylbut-2-enyl diphosphate reductase